MFASGAIKYFGTQLRVEWPRFLDWAINAIERSQADRRTIPTSESVVPNDLRMRRKSVCVVSVS
jgi:hypothetical protein